MMVEHMENKDKVLSKIARARLIGQLLNLRNSLASLRGLTKARTVRDLLVLRDKLGFAVAAPVEEVPASAPAPQAEPTPEQGAARVSTEHFYSVREKGSTSRQKLNDAAWEILQRIEANPEAPVSDADKLALAKYTGNGGGLIGPDGLKGSAYEYYTPKPIAAGIWEILKENGFSGGKVLDPSAGTGIFGATAPLNAAVDAVELSEISGKINQIVNGGPGYTTTISPFERVAAATPDSVYDAVVTNVPFGEKADRGSNYIYDERYQDEPLENYFILRSLEKLRPGGMAAFIVPTRCISGRDAKQVSLRERASLMAEFVGGYRLPTGTFSSADTDTVTDVMFFRKFNKETADKIEELRAQKQDVLGESKVLWDEFIDGKYFATAEGRPYVLGTFEARDPTKFRDVDKVINNASLGELKELMQEKKLPRSRIDWALLETTETEPIIYNEGDHITQAGVTLEMRNGVWVALQKTDDDVGRAELLGKLATPYGAFENNVSFEEAKGLVEIMRANGQALDVPTWLAKTCADLENLDEDNQKAQWKKALVALSVQQVLEERSNEQTVNFIESYAALSDALKRSKITQTDTRKVGGYISVAYKLARIHYTAKKGFSERWSGTVKEEVTGSDAVVQAAGTPEALFAAACYKNRSSWQTIEAAKEIFGADFDPMSDDAWCVSADGKKVCRADDYYVGNYAAFLKRMDEEIRAAGDETLKAKLTRQKLAAADRIDQVDTSKMSFNLHSPYVTVAEKVQFLKAFVSEYATEVTNESGKMVPDINIPYAKSDDDKLLNRIGDYLMKGTITLGGAEFETMDDRQALLELGKKVATANEQFNSWVKSNPTIMARLKQQSADPEKLHFKSSEDESEISIPGMRPELKLHGYQASYVRKMGREFCGINGFGVGLGKTFTALAAVQHVQAIGVKKKTLFVVPNSVLSNWKKEANRAYTSLDDCLFVGLRTNRAGKAVVQSSAYDEDLHEIANNRHSKIFMTMEAFERIKLRDETIEDYMNFMRRMDAGFSSESKKAVERKEGKATNYVTMLTKKAGAAPYLEDLGIDSVVFDEAHMYKNSAQTYDFKGARYLPEASASRRGIDAQAKAWYIRGSSALGDGVLMLTATPITNSPLEIYSMLSLAVGQKRVNDACVGINGADDFMETMCLKETEETTKVDGSAGLGAVFTGLDNLGILRKALGEVVTIKSAEDVGATVVIPEREEKTTKVTLSEDITQELERLKNAYRCAAARLKDDKSSITPEMEEAFESVQSEFGEPVGIIGHPFNLIKKMTALTADPELVKGASFYKFNVGDEEVAKAVVAEFNAKKFSEERRYLSEDQLSTLSYRTKTTKDDGDEITTYVIDVLAQIVEGETPQIRIESTNFKIQTALEEIAEKHGLELDVNDSPKLAAMIENFKNELQHPRGMIADGVKSPIVKQIIFCDMLGMHRKIRMLLQKRCGIPAGKIVVVTGQTNNTPEEIQGVQDGFNAMGEDNKYQVVIANEKAEVGINLQKGTQAIHHLTIGWTPDSLEQRNGRGARQGNKTQAVKIYYYDADGTFDTLKRSMVNAKNDWITNVTDLNGGDRVSVTGGLSNEDYDALIRSSGDPDAMRRYEEEKANREAMARAESNRERQLVNLDTIKKQVQFLDKYSTVVVLAREKLHAYWALHEGCLKLAKRVEKPEPRPNDVKKYNALVALRDAKAKEIDSGMTLSLDEDTMYDGVKALVDDFVKREYRTPNLERFQRFVEYRVKIDVPESSSVYGEWKVSIDQANGMIEQSIGSFEEQSKENGALPACLAEAMKRGEVAKANGVYVVVGTFIKMGDILAVVAHKDGWKRVYDLKGERAELPGPVETSNLFYPGTPKYEEALQMAAKIEDDATDRGEAFSPFSEIVPEVKKYRSTDSLVRYSGNEAKLPSPYFPYYITPDEAKMCPVCAAIAKEQQEIISSIDAYYFMARSSVGVEEEGKRIAFSVRAAALIEWAKAHNMTITAINTYEWKEFLKTVTAGKIDVSVLDHATTLDEFDSLVRRQVEGAVPGVTFGEDLDLMGFIDFYVAQEIKQRRQAYVNRAGFSPDDVVWLKGETYRYRNTIKMVALEEGYSAKWDGLRKMWMVRYSVYQKIVEEDPAFEYAVEVQKV